MTILKKLGALVPMALMVMSMAACDRTVTFVEENPPMATTCFSCHDDQDTFLIAAHQQWQNSIHASGHNIDRAGSASCAGCHSSEGFVQRVNGLEPTATDNPTVIHCFTCHAPHTNGNFGLRWTEAAVLENGESFDLGAGNLCAFCHHARRNVDTYVGTVGTDPANINSTHWGPHHSNQADMLIGSNGYEYAGYDYKISGHRSVVSEACADCHKNLGTSNNLIGGHSFNMRGLLRDEGGNLEELVNTQACENCHPTIGDFDEFDFNNVQSDVDSLITELEGMLETAGLWVNGHPNAGVTTSVDSAGAVWNLLMAEEDRSHGVHNANYTKGLLDSAIQYLQGNLSLDKPSSPGVGVRPGTPVVSEMR